MNQNGMTLMELLVVVSIVATIAGIVTMSTGNLRQTYAVKAAAREVFGDMQRARLAAIREGRNQRVCFSPGNTSFTSYTVVSGPGSDSQFCTADDEIVTSKDMSILFRGMSFTENFDTPSGTTSVTFTPAGTATTGNITITAATSTKTVTVNSSTGNIRIQ